MPPPHCDPDANVFIKRIFHDCVYNYRDYMGFTMGLASIATWMVAQFPQIIRNMKNRSAEALSVWFLAEWLLGDTCNLLGCVLTGSQLVTQTYTAMYFICADICLVMQYIYYGTLQRRRQRALRNQRLRSLHCGIEEGQQMAGHSAGQSSVHTSVISQLGQTPKPRMLACVALVVVGQQLWSGGNRVLVDISMDAASGRHLLGEASGLLLYGGESHLHWTKWFGQSIGWVSSFLYLGSRCAQIYKNWSRHSAEGLSIAMFGCAITANVLYGGGILIRTYAWKDLAASAPWLLGSLGTVFLDLVIFSQFAHYTGKRRHESTPLLEDDGAE